MKSLAKFLSTKKGLVILGYTAINLLGFSWYTCKLDNIENNEGVDNAIKQAQIVNHNLNDPKYLPLYFIAPGLGVKAACAIYLNKVK
jgi:hypothetical protein